MNYRSVFLATAILIGEKSSTSCLIAHNFDEKTRDCKQRICLISPDQVSVTCGYAELYLRRVVSLHVSVN
jgi:hypothetical protein